MPSILECTGLAVDLRSPAKFGGRAIERRVLDDVSFILSEGEIAALVGMSGAGKSTLAKALLALIPIAAGRVKIDGRIWRDAARPALNPSPADLAILRRGAQIVFQDPGASLTPHLTIGAQIEEAMAIHHLGDAASRRTRARDLAALAGLDADRLARLPGALSGGERQRAALARALAPGPKLLILDEATAALDAIVEARILETLRGLHAALGLTILIVTHDILLAGRFADRVICLDDKRIVEDAVAARFLEAPTSEAGRRLVAAARRLSPER